MLFGNIVKYDRIKMAFDLLNLPKKYINIRIINNIKGFTYFTESDYLEMGFIVKFP